MSSQTTSKATQDGIICRDRPDADSAEERVGAVREALSDLRDFEALATNGASKEIGNDTDIAETKTIMQRTLEVALDQVNEAEIIEGAKSGFLSEAEFNEALDAKRQRDLVQSRSFDHSRKPVERT